MTVLHLSQEALIQLGVITRNFPRIGSVDENCTVNEVDDEIETNHCINELSASKLAPCGCPTCSLPSPHPKELPFTSTEVNIPKM